jgi:hypothetical protein
MVRSPFAVYVGLALAFISMGQRPAHADTPGRCEVREIARAPGVSATRITFEAVKCYDVEYQKEEFEWVVCQVDNAKTRCPEAIWSSPQPEVGAFRLTQSFTNRHDFRIRVRYGPKDTLSANPAAGAAPARDVPAAPLAHVAPARSSSWYPFTTKPYEPVIEGPDKLKVGEPYVMSVQKPTQIPGARISWWIDDKPRVVRTDFWQIQGRGSKPGQHTLRVEVSSADKTFPSATKVVTVSGALPAVADTGWSHYKGYTYRGEGYTATIVDYIATTGQLVIDMPPYRMNMSPGELHYASLQTHAEGWGKGAIDDRTLTLTMYRPGQYSEKHELAQTVTLTR